MIQKDVSSANLHKSYVTQEENLTSKKNCLWQYKYISFVILILFLCPDTLRLKMLGTYEFNQSAVEIGNKLSVVVEFSCYALCNSMGELLPTAREFCLISLHTTMAIRTTNKVQAIASKITEMVEFLLAGSQFFLMLAERAQITTG